MDSIIKNTKARLAAAVEEELENALSGILDEYGPRFEAAAENEQQLQQAQEASRHEARKIKALEREVAYLRAPPHYRDTGTQTSPHLETPVDVPSRPLSETRRLSRDLTPRTFADIDEYERVKGELPGVRQYVQKLQNARVALEEKNRVQKAQLRHWAEYQKRWVLKYGPLERPITEHVEADADKAAEDVGHSHVTTESDSNPSSPALGSIPSVLVLAGNNRETPEAVVASISTLKRKRKRGQPESPAVKQSSPDVGTASRPVHIKSDPCSSPLNGYTSRLLDENHDSVDLDEVGSKTKTPRKHQRFMIEQAMLLQPNIAQADDLMLDRLAHDHGPRQDVASEKPQNRHRQVDDFNRRIEEAQRSNVRDKSKPETPKLYDRPTNLHRDFGTETARFGLPTPTTVVRQFEALREPLSGESLKGGQPINPSVLRPTDPNTQILPRTSDQSGKEKSHCPPSRRDRGAAQIHTVLEDGEETPASRQSKKQKRIADVEQGNADPTTAKGQESSGAHHRLSSLLAKPSPERPSLPSKPLSAPQRANQRNSKTPPSNLEPGALLSKSMTSTDLPRYKDAISNTTPLTSKSKKPATYAKKPALPVLASLDLTSSDDPPPIIPEDEPLRSRPVQRLRREDFKINPAANHGFTHAYREVVRKRTERKCLPNCNRPDCCGDTIKKMLAIGGPLMQRQPGLFESSPPEGDDGDAGYDYHILKEYMGDNYRSWTHLSDKEKNAEWTRAQQWSFGKRYGKHKAMARQRTPPGFWDNDIDSTQDLKQQREEGERIAREEVEERWREAMRPGGLWKFADE